MKNYIESPLLKQIDKIHNSLVIDNSVIDCMETLVDAIRFKNDYKWYLDDVCSIAALVACKRKLISSEEFCTILSVKSLIDDCSTQGLKYADITKIISLTLEITSDDANTRYTNVLKQSLKIGKKSSLFTEDILSVLLEKFKKFSLFERTIYLVKLNAANDWSMMLTILSESSKTFYPVIIEGEKFLVVPSFSIKCAVIQEGFRFNKSMKPIPVIGAVAEKKFVGYLNKGGRVVGYNFPNTPSLNVADMVFTGRYFFTEHDWSHVEENSFIPVIDRKLFTIFGQINFKFNQSTDKAKLCSSQQRIFAFSDMELKIYKLFYDKYGSSAYITKKGFRQVYEKYRYALILFSMIEVLGLPPSYRFTTLEMLAIEKDIFGFNSAEDNAIKKVTNCMLDQIQNCWYTNMDDYIKKILAYFVLYKKKLINNCAFNPDFLDWNIELGTTKELFMMGIDYFPSFENIKLPEIKIILKKFKYFYNCCKNYYDGILETDGVNLKLKTDGWGFPLPDYSFKTFHINRLELHINKGVMVRSSLLKQGERYEQRID